MIHLLVILLPNKNNIEYEIKIKPPPVYLRGGINSLAKNLSHSKLKGIILGRYSFLLLPTNPIK